MYIKYNKLWKLLIDKELKKSDLQRMAGISASTITKLGHNETVTSETLMKICVALNCTLNDIVEIEGENIQHG